MGTGTAVAGCTGGVDDLIDDGNTAVTFDPDDELSIYNSVKKLLDGHDVAQKLAKNAKKQLKKTYSVSGMINSALEIYRQVLN